MLIDSITLRMVFVLVETIGEENYSLQVKVWGMVQDLVFALSYYLYGDN